MPRAQEIGVPRQIEDQFELAVLKHDRNGFILNCRGDRIMLHQAGCDAVGAMVTSAYPKLFFETLEEATRWADKKFGKDGWEACGFCRYHS